MNIRWACLGGALVMAAGTGFGPPSARAGERPRTGAVDLSGEWRLNKQLSDGGQPTAPASSERQRDRDAPGPAAEPGATLTITQTELEVVVQEKPGQARSFYPNGKAYKADDGASDIRSQWKDGVLLVEKKNARGWKLTETWQLAPDGKRLSLDWRLEGGGRPRTAVRRVYDRVEPGP